MAVDNTKLIEEYIKDKAPETELDIVLCMAEVKAKYNAVQSETAKYFGISDRTLKNYKAKHKAEFEARLEEVMAQEVDELAGINPNQFVSEEQTDKFFRVMYEKAVSPQGTARDRELYMEATGLSGRDYFHLQSVKANTLRWFIKQNLSKISQYMDTKELGVQLQSSPYLYNGDKESLGNTQKFVDKSLDDESFKLELILAGLTFYSLFNGVNHPELEYMQNIVKLDRLEQEIKVKMNLNEVKEFARGGEPRPTSNKSLDEVLLELEQMDNPRATMEDVRTKYSRGSQTKAKSLVKPPKLPDVETVVRKADEHRERLRVLLSAQDEIKAMIEDSKRKYGWN